MSQRYTGSAVSIAASVNLPAASANSITVLGWLYLESSSGAGDVLYADAGGGSDQSSSIWLGFDSGNLVFDQQAGTYHYDQAATLNTWTHIALVFNSVTLQCTSYVNGSAVDVQSFNPGARANLNHIDIGFGGTFTVQGVMAFGAALTQAQVQYCMQRLAPPVSVSAYGYWLLDNGNPTLDSSGNSHTLDSAGNANGTQILMASSTNGIAVGGASVTVSSSEVLDPVMGTSVHYFDPLAARMFASVQAPQLLTENNSGGGSSTNAFPSTVLAFDASTLEACYWPTVLPYYPGSGNLQLVVDWFTSATSGNVVWGAAIGSLGEGSSGTSVLTKALATAQTATGSAGGSANTMRRTTITISNLDSIAAESAIQVKLYRDAANGSDTVAADAKFVHAWLKYSTT